MNFLSFAMSLLASPTTQPPPVEIPQGMSWCGGCERWTERDALPPSSEGNAVAPTFWFCVGCGKCDFDYVAEEVA